MKKIIFNETQFQDGSSESCGKFVLYFAIERMHNLDLSLEEILEEIFSTDCLQNETKVKEFCAKITIESD